MSSIEDLFKNYFGAYKNTSKYKDSTMLEIVLKKNEFEKNLDDMWDIYKRDPSQIIEYQKGIKQIKETGLRVFRNLQGKHKIIIPRKD